MRWRRRSRDAAPGWPRSVNRPRVPASCSEATPPGRCPGTSFRAGRRAVRRSPRDAKPFAGKVKSKSSERPGASPAAVRYLGEAFVVLVVVELRPCQLAGLGGVEDLGGQCLLRELDARASSPARASVTTGTSVGGRSLPPSPATPPPRGDPHRARAPRRLSPFSSQQHDQGQTCHHAPFGQPRQCLDIRPAMVTECSGSTAQTDRGRNAGPQSALPSSG